jgi:hypothetical protein
MTSIALHIRTKILPGHRIEIAAPDLPEGQSASVFVVLDEKPETTRTLWESLGDYKGGELFRTGEEVDSYLKSERESWEN